MYLPLSVSDTKRSAKYLVVLRKNSIRQKFVNLKKFKINQVYIMCEFSAKSENINIDFSTSISLSLHAHKFREI